MFCALYGATDKPRLFKARQSPAVMTLLPTSDAVPAISSEPATSEMLARSGNREALGGQQYVAVELSSLSIVRQLTVTHQSSRDRPSGERQVLDQDPHATRVDVQ